MPPYLILENHCWQEQNFKKSLSLHLVDWELRYANSFPCRGVRPSPLKKKKKIVPEITLNICWLGSSARHLGSVKYCCILQLCPDEQWGTCIYKKYKIIFLFLMMILEWSRRPIAESSHTGRARQELEEPVNDWL